MTSRRRYNVITWACTLESEKSGLIQTPTRWLSVSREITYFSQYLGFYVCKMGHILPLAWWRVRIKWDYIVSSIQMENSRHAVNCHSLHPFCILLVSFTKWNLHQMNECLMTSRFWQHSSTTHLLPPSVCLVSQLLCGLVKAASNSLSFCLQILLNFSKP